MKKSKTVTIICIIGCMLFTGCAQNASNGTTVPGNENADTVNEQKVEEVNTQANDATEEAIPEAEDDKADKNDTEKNDAEDVPSSVEEAQDEENVWDGGPDFTSNADELYGLTSDMTIEEMTDKYSLAFVDGGKYADYEGDIGDVIPEYKDKDLDGDHKSDVIKKEGNHYVIEFSRGGKITTGDFSASPNECEIIEFMDTACRNVDDILIAHYTFGTGGPVVWDTAIYSNADGQWKAYPLVDNNDVINSKELREHIEKRTGKPIEEGGVRVAAVEMTTLLLDFGEKNGPMQTHDYEAAYLHKVFSPENVNDREDYGYSGYSSIRDIINNWPLELTGDPVSFNSDLQYKLNIFMSNFSEQHFENKNWPLSYEHFALEWSRLNDPKGVSIKNDRYRIDHSTMNKILGRYFGTNLEEGDLYDTGDDNPYLGTIDFDEGKIWYSEPASDGEMFKYNAFTVVRGAEEITGDHEKFLRLEFDIYALTEDDYELNGIGKQQYGLTAAEAEKLADEGKLVTVAGGTAIVSDVGSDGYWLDYYKVNY